METACAALMQEESQRELLHKPKLDDTIFAIYVQGQFNKPTICILCNKRGHSSDT